MERSYTVKEIDALRKACEWRWLYGSTNPNLMRSSCSYRSEEKSTGVEELVRTYMIAGITAEDIYAADAGDSRKL